MSSNGREIIRAVGIGQKASEGDIRFLRGRSVRSVVFPEICRTSQEKMACWSHLGGMLHALRCVALCTDAFFSGTCKPRASHSVRTGKEDERGDGRQPDARHPNERMVEKKLAYFTQDGLW